MPRPREVPPAFPGAQLSGPGLFDLWDDPETLDPAEDTEDDEDDAPFPWLDDDDEDDEGLII